MPVKLLALLSCLYFFSTSHAQTEKGTRMIGASLASMVHTSGNQQVDYPDQQSLITNNKNLNLLITPSIGWFVSSHTVVGASLNIRFNHQEKMDKNAGKVNRETNSELFEYGGGIFLRQYLHTAGSLKPYGHVHASIGSGEMKINGYHYPVADQRYSYTGNSTGYFFYTAGVNAGATKFLGNSIGIDFFAGYVFAHNKMKMHRVETTDHLQPVPQHFSYEFTSSEKSNTHGFNLGIGLQVFFARK